MGERLTYTQEFKGAEYTPTADFRPGEAQHSSFLGKFCSINLLHEPRYGARIRLITHQATSAWYEKQNFKGSVRDDTICHLFQCRHLNYANPVRTLLLLSVQGLSRIASGAYLQEVS